MSQFKNFFKKKPVFITFLTVTAGLYIGTYVSINILLITFPISLVLYIITKRDIILLVLLTLSTSIYQASAIPEKWNRIFFSGLYTENRIIDPVYGEFLIKIPVSPGSIIYGSAKYIEWGSTRKLVEEKIEGTIPTMLNGIFRLRRILDERITQAIGGDIGKMCSGIVLGKREVIPRYMYRRFQYCGVAHLLAVSGLHTGIVFAIIFMLARVILKKRRDALVLTGVMVLLYALLSGFRIPVIRATIMIWFFIIGEIKEGNIDPLNTLSAAGILILFFMPGSISSISFQLSFVAVFSILVMLKLFRKRLSRISPGWIKNWLILPLFVTISAQIGTLPLVAYYFGYIPLFGMISNIILIPLVGSLIAGVFLLWILPCLSGIAGSFVWGVGYLMNSFMITLEKLPFAVINVPKGDLRILIVYPILLLPILPWITISKKRNG